MSRVGKPQFTLSTLREADHLSEIIHKINHEIGNPLTSIISLSAIMERAAEQTPEKISPYAAAIASEAWRVSALSERLVLLLSSRTEVSSPVAPQDALRKALTKLNRVEKYQEIEPRVTNEEGIAGVRIELAQLVGVFAALLENAYDAVLADLTHDENWRHDAVRVEIASDRPFVRISIASYSRAACPVSLDALFDPFVTTKPKNLGLGLTIVTSIVERFGGTIQCEETEQGDQYLFTTTIRLPLDRAEVNARMEPGNESLMSESIHKLAFPVTVVLIEDEPLVTSAIEKILWLAFSRYGVFRVVHLEAKEFLARLDKGFEFDAVLCDLHLGGISGRYVLDKVNEISPAAVSKFGFITGDRSRQETEKYLSSTGRPYLQKPFEPDELVAFAVELIRSGRKLF